MNKREQYILVTGASGYIGGRLVPRLLDEGYRVRVMTRDRERLRGRAWFEDVDIVEADAMNLDDLRHAMDGITNAYYLIHSMHKGDDFRERDRQLAHNFGQAASDAGIEEIVYLGGLGVADDELSEHLRSRQEVGDILRHYTPHVTEFRAAIIVGSGSVSFEMIRYLTERLPVMICPRWVFTKVQPLGIDDALQYLTAAIDKPETRGKIIEIGGQDVFTYADMLRGYADVRGLNRHIIPVPVLSPRLSSHWVHLVTPIPSSIARPLVDGLMNEVVVRNDLAEKLFPDIEPASYKEAVEDALSQLRAANVETSWSDSLASLSSLDDPYEFQEEQGMMIERRQRIVTASAEKTFEAVSRIGGSRGWLYSNWLWVLRGWLDRLLGGPGYRGGRRDPDRLRVGDTLDFWRVESVDENSYLRLRAEMLLPGRGWLEFDLNELENGKTCLTQTAYFAPKGFWGFAYWYSLFFAHKLIFDGMINELVREAETEEEQRPASIVEENKPLRVLGAIVGTLIFALGIGVRILTGQEDISPKNG